MANLKLKKDENHPGYYLDQDGNIYVFRYGGRPIKVEDYLETDADKEYKPKHGSYSNFDASPDEMYLDDDEYIKYSERVAKEGEFDIDGTKPIIDQMIDSGQFIKEELFEAYDKSFGTNGDEGKKLKYINKYKNLNKKFSVADDVTFRNDTYLEKGIILGYNDEDSYIVRDNYGNEQVVLNENIKMYEEPKFLVEASDWDYDKVGDIDTAHQFAELYRLDGNNKDDIHIYYQGLELKPDFAHGGMLLDDYSDMPTYARNNKIVADSCEMNNVDRNTMIENLQLLGYNIEGIDKLGDGAIKKYYEMIVDEERQRV